MKKVIIQYGNFDEYSKAYSDFEARGFNVAVVMGLEFAISINADEIAWLTIMGCAEFEKDMIRGGKIEKA